ncbi:MAG TPA: hypothetical protein VJU59_11005, partial [Paraburkholderia sp.]|uniref:hypothetical protein n=1 Tax=Paraburkholderia sp. TaxID=1926495 RepID=UPI002B494F9A
HSRPGMHCGCGVGSLPGSTGLSSPLQDQEIELHRVTRLLLNPAYRPELTREILASAAQARSRELGLITEKTSNSGRVRDFFFGHPWRAVLERTRVLAQVQPTTGYLTGDLVFRNPLQSIALLSALYGNWSSAEKMIEKISHPLVHERNSIPQLGLALTKAIKKSKYKKTYLLKNNDRLFSLYTTRYSKIRRERPNLSHGEIVRAIGGTGLSTLDRESLHQAGIDVPFYKLTDEAYKQIDIDLAEHVLNKNDELKAKQFSGNIGAFILLRDFGFGKYQLLKGRIPLTEAALDLCVNWKPPPHPNLRTEPRRTKRARHPGGAKTAPVGATLVQFASAPDDVLEERTLRPCEAP